MGGKPMKINQAILPPSILHKQGEMRGEGCLARCQQTKNVPEDIKMTIKTCFEEYVELAWRFAELRHECLKKVGKISSVEDCIKILPEDDRPARVVKAIFGATTEVEINGRAVVLGAKTSCALLIWESGPHKIGFLLEDRYGYKHGPGWSPWGGRLAGYRSDYERSRLSELELPMFLFYRGECKLCELGAHDRVPCKLELQKEILELASREQLTLVVTGQDLVSGQRGDLFVSRPAERPSESPAELITPWYLGQRIRDGWIYRSDAQKKWSDVHQSFRRHFSNG